MMVGGAADGVGLDDDLRDSTDAAAADADGATADDGDGDAAADGGVVNGDPCLMIMMMEMTMLDGHVDDDGDVDDDYGGDCVAVVDDDGDCEDGDDEMMMMTMVILIAMAIAMAMIIMMMLLMMMMMAMIMVTVVAMVTVMLLPQNTVVFLCGSGRNYLWLKGLRIRMSGPGEFRDGLRCYSLSAGPPRVGPAITVLLVEKVQYPMWSAIGLSMGPKMV